MKANIVLIGFMGTGKTTIGKELARCLKKPFFDSDQEIEEMMGMSISEIFAKFGEPFFRSKENIIVKKLAEYEDCIIATGGGVVLNPANIKLLKEKGIIVCLTAQPAVIYERVKNDTNLPLLQNGDMYQAILRLMKQREGLYHCADVYIDTSDGDYDRVVEQIALYYKNCRNDGHKELEPENESR